MLLLSAGWKYFISIIIFSLNRVYLEVLSIFQIFEDFLRILLLMISNSILKAQRTCFLLVILCYNNIRFNFLNISCARETTIDGCSGRKMPVTSSQLIMSFTFFTTDLGRVCGVVLSNYWEGLKSPTMIEAVSLLWFCLF